MARSSRQYRTAATTGCSSGQMCLVTGEPGLPNSSRTPATMTVTGFHDAIHWSAFGIVLTGTNALLRNVSGNTTVNATPITASGVRTLRPIQVPIQIIADANSNSSSTASPAWNGSEWTPQPTISPVASSTTIETPSPASSARK